MLWQSLVSSYNASQKDSHRTFGMCPLTFKICLKCVLSKGLLCMDQGVAVHSLWPSLKWMSNCCGPCWLRDSKYCMLLPQNGISKNTWGSMWLTCWTLRKFIWILMQTQWTKGLHTSFQNDYKRLTKLWTVKVIEMILTAIIYSAKLWSEPQGQSKQQYVVGQGQGYLSKTQGEPNCWKNQMLNFRAMNVK